MTMSKTDRSVNQCVKCGCKKSHIVDSRARDGVLRRIRVCTKCQYRWTTIEMDIWEYEKMMEANKHVHN